MAGSESWEEVEERLLADPATREEYERTRPGYELARILVEVRSKLGLSQRDLAVAAGVPQSTIGRIESRETSPTWDTIFRILDAVGARIDVDVGEWKVGRGKVLEVESAGYRFRTIPAKPGFLEVFRLDDGRKDGAGAAAWPGTPIVELEPAPNGVIVRTRLRGGRIAKNAKGHWTLSEDLGPDTRGVRDARALK